VRQLLNHTSGIFNYTDDEAFVQRLFAEPLRVRTPQELIDVATAHPPVFAPGTSWSYSNTNYIVTGLILERVTHRSLSSLLRQRIIGPLRLHDTVYPTRSPNIPGYHAHGYLPPSLSDVVPPPWGGQDRYVDISVYTPTLAGAAGALISNPDDLRRFYRALLSGRLLRPAQLAEMKTMVELDQGSGYGLGLYTMDTPCGRIWGHDGGIPGYTTIAWNDESGRRGFVAGLSTEQDEAIAEAFNTVLLAAVCRVFGQPVPSATTAAAGAAALPRVDRVDRSLLAARPV
jgi:D-alanyl-D-alanine carboxypeptidase